MLSEELEDGFEPAPDLVVYRAGNADPSWLPDALQARRDIHAVAIYGPVPTFDDLAEIDSDAKAHPARFRQRVVAFSELALNFQCRTHGLCYSPEHGEHAISRHIHDTTAVGFDFFTEDGAIGFERGHGGLVVVLHETRVPRNIGDENRLELSAAFGVGHNCVRP